MAIRTRCVGILALAFSLAACGTQALAPRGEEATLTASPSATPLPTNASTDIVYVRETGKGGATLRITALDARTGWRMRDMADGAVSPDRSLVYSTEPVNGQTVVHATELATGLERRAFAVDGDLRAMTPLTAAPGVSGLSPNGRWLALTTIPYRTLQSDGTWVWVSKLAVVDTGTGLPAARVELAGASIYAFAAIAPNGLSLYLDEGATRMRIYDVRAKALLPDPVPGTEPVDGWRSQPVASPDGRWLYSLYASPTAAPFVLALDLDGRRARRVTLPAEQAADWEKAMLWSLVAARNGSAIYAVNPALGVADEIDAAQLALRRAGRITVSRASDTPRSAIARAFFPVAEAKRYVVAGAVLSPDGRTIYAVGDKGIAAIDTARLESRGTWYSASSFDSLALSPDGARLYALDDHSRNLAIVSAVDGTVLGVILTSYPLEVVRIDLAP